MPIESSTMDFGLITSAVGALVSAKDIGAAMIGVRDNNLVALKVSQMNEQILKAQEALLTHSLQMGELQQRYFEALEKLRAVEKLIADRGRYTLVELTPGAFAYRLATPQLINQGDEAVSEPAHYVCQPCFDKDIKVVLQRAVFYGTVKLRCSCCATEYDTGETIPYSAL